MPQTRSHRSQHHLGLKSQLQKGSQEAQQNNKQDQGGNATLHKIFYDAEHPAGYGSINKLQSTTGIPKKKVQEWLSYQDTYTLHKPAIKKFKRNRIYVNYIDQQWQADLCDMRHLAKHNSGNNYLMTVIDCFSKFAWALPLKRKTGEEITLAFKNILKKSKRKPTKFNTDKGTEFTNKIFQTCLKEMKIKFFTSNNPDIKASIIERFNRTLKTKMWKYFTHKNTFRYIEILPKLLKSYNASYHRSIKRSPDSVTKTNQADVYNALYGSEPTSKFKFDIGDKVRISRSKDVFEKGYVPNWTEEIFTISEKLERSPPVYKIKDLNGEEVQSVFYEQELQKVRVKDDREYHVEKILESKGKGSKLQHFVKWEGYPDTFNSWILASKLKKI